MPRSRTLTDRPADAASGGTALVSHVAEFCLTAALLIGGFSLSRIDPSLERLGTFGELRYWLLAISATALISHAAVRPRTGHANSRVVVFLAALTTLHLVVLISALWGIPHGIERGFPKLDLVASMLVAPLAVLTWREHAERGLLSILGGACLLSVVLVIAAIASGEPFAGEFQAFGAGGIGTARTYGLALIGALYISERFQRHAFLLLVPIIMLGILASGARAVALGTVVGVASWFAASLFSGFRR